MKTHTLSTLALLALSSALPLTAAPVTEFLEDGVQLQEIEGDHEAAIRSYKKVIAEAEGATDALAEARFRMVQCYSELGNDELAKDQADLLQKTFGAENKWVKRLTQLDVSKVPFLDAPWSDGEYASYDVKLPNGKTIGHFQSAVIRQEVDGKPAWQSFFGRNAGGYSASTCIFGADGFQPIASQVVFEAFGNVVMNYRPNGKMTLQNLTTGAVDSGSSVGVFDNDQFVTLVRAIDFSEGEDVTVMIKTLFFADLALVLSPVGTEMVETPAGKFECLKVKSNINQTFYVGTDERRHLVKLDMPGASAVLACAEDWNAVSQSTLGLGGGSLEVTLPAGSMWYPVKDGENDGKSGSYVVFQVGDMHILRGQIIFRDVEETDYDALEKKFIELSQEKHPDFRMVGEWEEISVGGLSGEFGVNTFKNGELDVTRMSALLGGEGRFLVVHCIYQPESGEDDVRTSLLEMVESVKLSD